MMSLIFKSIPINLGPHSIQFRIVIVPLEIAVDNICWRRVYTSIRLTQSQDEFGHNEDALSHLVAQTFNSLRECFFFFSNSALNRIKTFARSSDGNDDRETNGNEMNSYICITVDRT